MQKEEKQLIDAMFRKVREIAREGDPRDLQVETLINEHMRRIPGSAYIMAQAIIVQQQALKQAEARIAELERQRRGAGSGFAQRQSPAAPQAPQATQQRGGGFLAGVAQTALGIGGGMLLANAGMELARSIFGGDDFSANDLFDAYDAGLEDAAVDEAVYEAGYEDAAADLGDSLFGDDDTGLDDDFFDDSGGWDDDW